jgi:hypothetical protein
MKGALLPSRLAGPPQDGSAEALRVQAGRKPSAITIQAKP